jgi:hypothetical protein
MNGPRRAKHQPNPLTLVLIIGGVALILFAIVIANIQTKPQAAPPPTQPTATWTTYIPATPQTCRDMIKAADRMYDQANKTNEATLDAAEAAAKQQFAQAERAIDKAQSESKKLAAMQKTYLVQAKKCNET